jgi:hypothetical protein
MIVILPDKLQFRLGLPRFPPHFRALGCSFLSSFFTTVTFALNFSIDDTCAAIGAILVRRARIAVLIRVFAERTGHFLDAGFLRFAGFGTRTVFLTINIICIIGSPLASWTGS